jgi:hypothetical protein
MAEFDSSLFPYMSCFVTTSVSENLWYARGQSLSSFDRKSIVLPDGAELGLLAPSDHTMLWSALCHYRDQAKKRIDESMNASMIVQALVGRKANLLTTELQNISKSLQVDIIDPWKVMVHVRLTEKDKNDGWAHGMHAETVEDLHRELNGMAENDRHEQVFQRFHDQQIEEAKRRQEHIERTIRAHQDGVWADDYVVQTDEEVMQRELAIKQGRSAIIQQQIAEITEPEVELSSEERVNLRS